MAKKNSPIIVRFTAFNRKGSGTYNENSEINSPEELATAVEEFEDNCPFRKYEMETEAEHANGKPLTKQEREWFTKQDQESDIGFI